MKRAAIVVGCLAPEQEARFNPDDIVGFKWDSGWTEEREDGMSVRYTRTIQVPFMPEVLADLRTLAAFPGLLAEGSPKADTLAAMDAAARVRAAIGDEP